MTARCAALSPASRAIAKEGRKNRTTSPAWSFIGKYVFIAEGARGSLAKAIMEQFELRKGRYPQKFGIGLKELWEVTPENHSPGRLPTRWAGRSARKPAAAPSCIISRTIWSRSALSSISTTTNPYLYPYMEFQRFKHHPLIEPVLEGGRRIAYGARAITEGGLQSVPKLCFPGRRADRLLRRGSSTCRASRDRTMR